MRIASRVATFALAALSCLVLSAVSGCFEPPDIDNVGGVIFVYALAPTVDGPPAEPDADLQRSMIAVLRARLDPTGNRGIRVSFNQAGEVEIAVPGHDSKEHSRVQSLATSTGRLEFLILANPTDHANLIDQAEAAKSTIVRADEAVVGRWVKAQTTTPSGAIGYRLSALDETLRDGASGNPVVLSADERGRAGSNAIVMQYLLKDKNVTDLEVLVAVDADPSKTLQGKHLADVSQGVDSVSQPCIQFQMTKEGAKLLKAITAANLPDHQVGVRRKLGIILDDHLISAPAIMSTISDRGQITGNFTEDEVRQIVAVLNAGELPAPLQGEPVRVINVQGENAPANESP